MESRGGLRLLLLEGGELTSIVTGGGNLGLCYKNSRFRNTLSIFTFGEDLKSFRKTLEMR